MTFTFEHSDADGDYTDTYSDKRTAVRTAREEWNLTWEGDRRRAVDASLGHHFRVLDEKGRTVYDWADHYRPESGRFILPPEYGDYLDRFFEETPPSDMVSDSLGDPRKAAEKWIRETYRESDMAQSNVEGLRETLGIGPEQLVDTVENWFRQEYLDYTVANAKDDMADMIPSLIMDDGLSVREAQVVALQRLGVRPTESMHILMAITGKPMTINNVSNALKSAKMKKRSRSREKRPRKRA